MTKRNKNYLNIELKPDCNLSDIVFSIASKLSANFGLVGGFNKMKDDRYYHIWFKNKNKYNEYIISIEQYIDNNN